MTEQVFKGWLDRQREYQTRVFGVDYERMWSDPDAVELTRYVTEMFNAAFLELAEAQQETPWKSWAMTENRVVAWQECAGKVHGELVDVMFFIANILAALGVTDKGLHERYLAKMGVNEQRQEDGYDGVSTKCPFCRRALDEPGTVPFHAANGFDYCSTLCAVADEKRCAKCGYEFRTEFELRTFGLDNRVYCSTQHAFEATGGQRYREDDDE